MNTSWKSVSPDVVRGFCGALGVLAQQVNDSTYQFAAYLLTRQHFLVFIEDLLADLPGEGIVRDPPLQETGACVVPTFLNPATPANSTEVSTTPLGRRRDLFLGDNLDLWLEPTRAAV
jgi:hypothetical protein